MVDQLFAQRAAAPLRIDIQFGNLAERTAGIEQRSFSVIRPSSPGLDARR